MELEEEGKKVKKGRGGDCMLSSMLNVKQFSFNCVHFLDSHLVALAIWMSVI